MRLKNPHQQGPAVKRIQEQLEHIGYKIDTDGVFGPQTDEIVREFQEKHHLKVDGIVGMETRRMLRDIINGHWPKLADYPGKIYHLRKHPRPRLYAGIRGWDEIDGVVLHQTGCKMPRDPEGWKRLNAHVGVTSEGTVVIVNDPTVKIWHAQKLSRRTIGIEIAGNFHGIEGDPGTLWEGGGPAATLGPNQKMGCDVALAWVEQMFRHNHQEWKYIYAHRQSSKTRSGDPGSEIWQQVAMPWIKRLGLSDGGEYYRIGSGRKIPRDWNADYEKNRYWG
jgi:hypothetical protein